MKKEPPDVMYITTKSESPLFKWLNLMDWAKRNKDEYLYQRVKYHIENITL